MSTVHFDFSQKKYVVVGASSGIGRQVTKEICNSGGNVLSIARDETRLKDLKEQLGDRVVTKSVDVRDKKNLESTITGFVEEYGKFDGSVYTAGISRTTVLRSFSEEDALSTMDINFWGWVNVMSILGKKKYTMDGCSHVCIASVAAHTGESGSFAYDASKSALISCAKAFAKELAKRKCRINTISPGFVVSSLTNGYFENRGFSERTIDKHLLGLGTVEDVSGLILFLLSDRARWITGSDYVIDGGYLVSD